MNLLTFLIFLEGAGLTKRAPKDPSSKAGMRPDCGLGSDAKLIQPDDTGQNDYWICVPTFK
jgi:hypothetical protein